MFLDYYQLREQPFGPAIDPAHVYPSQTYREALSSLSHSILGNRGNLALLAEPGVGKTTLLQQLLEGLPQTGRVTSLFQKHCDSREILQFLLVEMGVDSTAMDLAAMHSKLNAIWFAEMLAGKRFVLLFDDAEALDHTVLETLRFLSKFETSNTKFLQVLLCGRPQLLQNLESKDLAPLRQGLADVIFLERISPMETAAYIRHRLYAAGHRGKSLFAPEALALIAELSLGVPQNINRICSRALLEAYARGLYAVSDEIVEKAERHLTAIPAAEVIPMEAPSHEPTAAEAQEVKVGPTGSQLTYKTSARLGLPGSGLLVGAILGVLLSAGLALPHGMLRGVTQIMRGKGPSATSAQPRAAATQPLSTLHPPALDTHAPPEVQVKSSLTPDAAPPNVPLILLRSKPPEGTFSLTRELGLKINRIVIDPGHGGFDTGAKGRHGLLEKDLCLDVALRLGQMIEENIPGAQVVYTRKDDSYVPLEERTAIANGADADLFISIHANSSDASEVRGVETYYLSLATSKEAKELAIRENAFSQSSLHDLPDLVKKITRNERIAESKLLALEIQDMLSQRLQLVSRHEKNRGVKQAPFIVLTGANMPAVLSEISFVSNASDESLLLEGGQRQRIAEGLYRGIAAYLDGLRALPENKQKLVTENRANVVSAFGRPNAEAGRNPL